MDGNVLFVLLFLAGCFALAVYVGITEKRAGTVHK